MGDNVLPVGRLTPAPSSVIDRTLNSVRITGKMELYGHFLQHYGPLPRQGFARWRRDANQSA